MKIKRVINLNEEREMLAKMNPEFVVAWYEAQIAKLRRSYKNLTPAQESRREHRGELRYSRRMEA